MSILYLHHDGSAYPALDASQVGMAAPVLRRMERHLQFRRNARSPAYMAALANDCESGNATVSTGKHLATVDWAAISKVVLLWPDGNGLGWSPVEREVWRRMAPGTELCVLNGRRRRFHLDRTMWRKYRFRRFLEKIFLVDVGASLIFLATAPILFVADRLRGRK